MSDDRIVYSVSGTWWDSIDKVAVRDGLPCCPHCGSLLFEMNEWNWWKSAKAYDNDNPGYLEMLKWARGKCFPNMPAMQKAYDGNKR